MGSMESIPSTERITWPTLRGIERLDALESLITDFNAHTVLLLQGKRAFVPGWNKRGATIQEIEEHLATDPLSNVGIIPYSVNTHVLDVDRGDPKDWYSFRKRSILYAYSIPVANWKATPISDAMYI